MTDRLIIFEFYGALIVLANSWFQLFGCCYHMALIDPVGSVRILPTCRCVRLFCNQTYI